MLIRYRRRADLNIRVLNEHYNNSIIAVVVRCAAVRFVVSAPLKCNAWLANANQHQLLNVGKWKSQLFKQCNTIETSDAFTDLICQDYTFISRINSNRFFSAVSLSCNAFLNICINISTQIAEQSAQKKIQHQQQQSSAPNVAPRYGPQPGRCNWLICH